MSIENKYLEKKYTSLNETEILDLMLYISGYKNLDSKREYLFEKYISLNLLCSKNYDILFSDNNINKRFILLIKLLKDFSEYVNFNDMSNNLVITSSSDSVVKYLKSRLAYLDEERVQVIFLTTQYEIIKIKTISKGTIDRSIIYIRDIVKEVIYTNTKFVILAHNHPSGSLVASQNDINMTKKIKTCLNMFEIELLDHIIITKKGYYSFAEGGLL